MGGGRGGARLVLRRTARKQPHALAVVGEYNYGQEAEPGKGSAIFLHVGDEPTSGCIALEKANLTALVQWLDEDASPRIVIAQDG